MPSLSTHEGTSSQFAMREKIAAPLVKAIGTFFAVAGPREYVSKYYGGILAPAGGAKTIFGGATVTHAYL